jgi:DNA-directed RNA polymerase subunit alpha
MVKINCVEEKIEQDGTHSSYFVIQPLEIGHGITIGNTLRRVLLADLYGSAIVGVRINDLKHEFSNIPGVKEEPLEIVMNLKEIIFKKNFQSQFSKKRIRSFLHVKGPIVVTAGMFQLPKNQIKILNPKQYICSILTPSELYLEIDIDTDKGFRLVNYEDTYLRRKKFADTKGGTILIDALFSPIKQANYKIKLIHDALGNLKESLHFEIVTNGTISPYRALLEGNKVLLNLFIPFLTTNEFLNVNETFIPFSNDLQKENFES